MQSDERPTRGLPVIFAAAFALLIAGVTVHWRMSPDSAIYAGIARSLATGRGYTFAGDPQLSIPPVVPVYLSAAYRLGEAVEPGISWQRIFLYLNAASALWGMAGLAAGYLLIREMAPPRRALPVLVLLATSTAYLSLAVVPLTDVPYGAVSWAALVCLLRMERGGERRWRIAAAVLLLVAVLTRLVGVILLLCVLAYYLAAAARRGGDRARAIRNSLTALPGLAAAAVFVYVIWSARGTGVFNYWDDLVAGWKAREVAGHFLANVTALPGTLFCAVVSLDSIAGIKLILAALVLWGAVVSWRNGARLPVVYFISGMVYICLGYEFLERYFVAFLPLVYLFMIEGADGVSGLVRRRFTGPAMALGLRRTGIGLFAALVAVNCVYVGREIVYNYSGDFYGMYRHGKYQDYILLAQGLSGRPPAGRIMAPPGESRILAVLSDLLTMPPAFHPEAAYRVTREQMGRLVRNRRVTNLLVDPSQPESARIFEDFIRKGPFKWRKEQQFGRLAYYVLEGKTAVPPDAQPPPAPG